MTDFEKPGDAAAYREGDWVVNGTDPEERARAIEMLDDLKAQAEAGQVVTMPVAKLRWLVALAGKGH